MMQNSRVPLPRSERGAAMLAALCLAMVFAISLSSYIALCYVSLTMSTRNIMLTHCTELAETGVEQALYAVNNKDWSNWTLAGGNATETMTMTQSGLVLSSLSPTPLNYGNGMNGLVNITVNNYNTTAPSISSQGVFTLPLNSGGTQPTTSSTVTYNAVPAPETAAIPLFVNAVAATTGNVRFNAGGAVDSYNSDPVPGSGNYVAYAPAIAGYSAVIASQNIATFAASVRLGNAVVHGYATGYNTLFPATTNWLSYGGGGQLVGPNTLPATSIDSNRLVTTPVPYQPEFLLNPPAWTTLPTACSTDSGATINNSGILGIPTATAPTVYYASNGINLPSGKTVVIQGPVVIESATNVLIAGGIVLTTPQASLQIFLMSSGTTLNLGGNGITNTNAVPLPKKVAIMTTNASGTVSTVSTTQPFYGVIYLPNMPIIVSTAQPIYGSIVGQGVTFTNAVAIHYDLALRNPMPAYSGVSLLTEMQYGAAFDNLFAPSAFTNMVATVP